MGNVPLMLGASVLAGLGTSPVTGDLNALIAAASDYTYRTRGKRVGMAPCFPCSSPGNQNRQRHRTALADGFLQPAATWQMRRYSPSPASICLISLVPVVPFDYGGNRDNPAVSAEGGEKPMPTGMRRIKPDNF